MDDLENLGIITPKEFLDRLKDEFGELYDPCPYPCPDNFDGLNIEWGQVSYVNPPFWKGCSTIKWIRKAIEESKKGKTVILALPVYNWIKVMLENCDGFNNNIRYMKDWYWLTPKGEKRKPHQPVILWVIKNG